MSTFTQHSSRRETLNLTAKSSRLKILILRVRLLYPLNCAGKIRTAKILEQLNKHHDVTLVAYRFPEDTDEDEKLTAEHCSRLITIPYTEAAKGTLQFYSELGANLLQSKPYVVSKYSSRAMARSVEHLYHAMQPDLIICDFLQSCEALRYIPHAPFVLFQHNVEAIIFEQMASRATHFWERAFHSLQGWRLRRYERKMCRRATRVFTVSEIDCRDFAEQYDVHHCDVVPTGVDTDYYQPSASPPRTNNIVFSGSMDWIANQDAVQYFVRDILPLVRKEIPDVMFSVVGRNPPPEIRKLGEAHHIHITGNVDDIRPFLRAAKVYVAPMRMGSGTRLKLFEAMAMGKAIVSTSSGAAGLPVHYGKNIVFADTPERFAQQVIELMRDHYWRELVEQNARALVEKHHSWKQVGQVFNELCYSAMIGTYDRRKS